LATVIGRKAEGDFLQEDAETKVVRLWAALRGAACFYIYGTNFLYWIKTEKQARGSLRPM
jgi:hypothetical protein